jgi:hypothetical protein
MAQDSQRNAVNGKVLIGTSIDLPSILNRQTENVVNWAMQRG